MTNKSEQIDENTATPYETDGMYEQFQMSGSLEVKGVELDYGSFRVTIARAGGANKKYERLLAAKRKPYTRQIQTETMSEDLANKILQEVFTETIVLRWETRVGEDEFQVGIRPPPGENNGKLLPFNKESMLFTFKNLEELWLDIRAKANQVSLFREQELEEDAKN